MTNVDPMATNDRPPRVNLQLSPYQMELLELWAAWNNRPPATYASQILAARLEANRETIMGLVDHAAERDGVTRDEMIERWLGESER